MSELSPLFFILTLTVITALSACVTHYMSCRMQIWDVANERSSHRGKTPKSGGLAIIFGFFVALGCAYFLPDYFTSPTSAQNKTLPWFAVILATFGIALISFLDDLREVSAKLRLATHFVLALMVVLSGLQLTEMSFLADETIVLAPLWAIVLALIWIVGLTNAVNFMDGIDGLIAVTAVIAAAGFSYINVISGNLFIAYLSAAIAASSLGFLYFNWAPAKIFMGDIGSAFLGFMFACLALIAAKFAKTPVDFWVMPLLLFHLIFDVTITLIRRAKQNKNLLQAHREHLYQLLVQTGLSHAHVSSIALAFVITQFGGALLLLQMPNQMRLLVFIPFLLIQSGYAFWVLKRAQRARII